MEDILFALQLVAPLFLVIAAGWFCRRIRLLDDRLVSDINNLAFRAFFPILLCRNMMTAELPTGGCGRVFLFVGIGITASFLLLFLLVPLFEKDKAKRGTLIQGMARGNYLLFGVSLISSMYPPDKVGLASLLVIMIVPLLNVLSVVALAVFCGAKASARDMLRKILLNPLIIGSVIGFLLMLAPFKLPGPVDSAIAQLASVAAPLALFTLGASLQFRRIGKNAVRIAAAVLVKLVALPAIALSLAAALGFRGVELACVMIAFAAPAAVNSYTMAEQMGGDGELAAEIVVATTAASVVTIFLVLLILRRCALL